MPEIWCYTADCRYCKNDRCTAEMVEIDDEGACDTFESFLTTEEYNHSYYIAVRTESKEPAKAVKKGRLVEINEIMFFTESPPLAPESETYITHARTGLTCGTVAFIKANFDKFMKAQESVANIETLPLAEWDEKKRKFILIKEA